MTYALMDVLIANIIYNVIIDNSVASLECDKSFDRIFVSYTDNKYERRYVYNIASNYTFR